MKTKTRTARTDEEMHEFLETLKSGVLPKMRASAVVCATLDPQDIDAFLLLQIGAALVLDKPLIILASPGMFIPARLHKLADEIVIGEISEEATRERMSAAMTRVLERITLRERKQ